MGKLYDTKELAEYLGVSEWTIYGWRKRGNGPRAVKLGGGSALRWRERDVAEWLEQSAETEKQPA